MLMNNISEIRNALGVKLVTKDLSDNAKSKLKLTHNQIADFVEWRKGAYVGATFFTCNQVTGNFYPFTAEEGFISVHELTWN